jgi:uncharacterized membrane protein
VVCVRDLDENSYVLIIGVIIGRLLGENNMGALIGSIAGLLLVIIEQINSDIVKLKLLAGMINK